MTHYEDMDFVSSLRCHYCQRKIASHYKRKLKRAGNLVASMVQKNEMQYSMMQMLSAYSLQEMKRLNDEIHRLETEACGDMPIAWGLA